MIPPTVKSVVAIRRQPGKWSRIFAADLTLHLGLSLAGSHRFISEKLECGQIDGSLLTIRAGYAWDACSPAADIRGTRLGTPSPSSTDLASGVHDFLYQFGRLPCAPWSFAQADKVFLALLRQQRFPLAVPYFLAVRTFGGLHRALTRPTSTADVCCGIHPLL